jgi:hypothetical protein
MEHHCQSQILAPKGIGNGVGEGQQRLKLSHCGSKMGKLEFPARGWMNAVPRIRLSVGIPDQATCTITHAWIKRDGDWYYEPIAVQIRP